MLGAIILGGSMLAGSILNSYSQAKTIKAQNKIAKENLDFQKDVYNDEKALTDKYEKQRDLLKKSSEDLYANTQDTLPTLRV